MLEPKTYGRLISLGYNCQPRFTLRRFFDHEAEFVLDGLISYKLERINELLKTEFSSFFLPENTFHEDGSDGFLIVKDGLNEITSIHDVRSDIPWENAYQDFVERKRLQYTQLIQFVKSSPESLLFVRRNKAFETLKTCEELVETIRILRGDKPFDVFVFQNKPYMGTDFGIPNLHTFYDGCWEFQNTWVGDSNLWNTVFQNIKIHAPHARLV